MGQLNNVRRIVAEDFPEDVRDTVSKLASILNSHMDDVVELADKNITYENLDRTQITIDVTVDASGKPRSVSQINIGLTSYTGKVIQDVIGLDGGSVISTPYLDCTYQGNGIVRINRILGLPAGKKMRLVIEFIG
jgi:alcohol dehydrogenase class IV